MRPSARPGALLALVLAALPGGGEVLVGPLDCTAQGVALGERHVAWASIASLEERPATAQELAAERERWLAAAGRSPARLVEVGRRLRALGREQDAREAFAAALDARDGYAPAREALGEVRVDGTWRDAREVLRVEDPRALPIDERVERAAACRAHGLLDEEVRLLASAPVEDGMHAAACAAMRARLVHRPPTRYAPPLEGRWRAVVDRTRHHRRRAWALFALDLVAVDEDGHAWRGDGAANEDHLTFDAPVLAVADGVVVEVTDDTPDQKPGDPGTFGEANTVSVRHANGEHSDFFHLRRGSIVVREGDRVRRGELLGRVGNSGASGAPHLHFEVSIPLHEPDGGEGAEWLGVPFAWEGFRLVAVDGTECDVEVRAAAPLEGWTMMLPSVARTDGEERERERR
jgi:hypothetical protein